MLMMGGVGFLLNYVYKCLEKFCDVIDCMVLKLFIVGVIFYKFVVVCYVWMLLIIFVVGVLLVEVFDLVFGVIGNVVFRDVVGKIK